MPDADVVITGVGAVTPLGATARGTSSAWLAGRAAERHPLPELAGTPLAEATVAVWPQADAAARLGNRKLLKFMSDAALLGCVAAREASAEACLKDRFPPERVGLFAASGLTVASVAEARPMIEASLEDGRISYRRFGTEGLAAANPLFSFKVLPNMPPCLVSILEQLKGPNYLFSPWEGQAAAALVEAWRAVAAGEVDAALAGAADNAAHPARFLYLRQAGFLRPDDFPASAAAYLVFERADTARRDNRQVLASVRRLEVVAAAPELPAPSDPLASRMGRTFAAAPALLLVLSALLPAGHLPAASLTGADLHTFSFELEASP